MPRRLVVIGNGMAGHHFLEELLECAGDRFDITVFGAELGGAYNRVLLSPVLAGDKTAAEIALRLPEWYAEQRLTLHAGDAVLRIERDRKRVVARSGRMISYDVLVVATGSRPFVPPIPGVGLPGVVAFRRLADVERMTEAAARGGRAVVIGGGLLGLEAAAGLERRGMSVTVVHLLDSVMERQLDGPAGAMLQADLERRGIAFVLNAETTAIEGDAHVDNLRLKDGRTLPADLVVLALGIQPETEIADAAGLACRRGILVDDALTTSDPWIHALGECAEHRGRTYGLIAPLYDQARMLARHLAGDEGAIYGGSVAATGLKVAGIDTFSVGATAGEDEIVYQDPAAGIYRKLIMREGRLQGAVLYGDAKDGAWYADLLRRREDIGARRAGLVFGRAFAESKS